MKINTATNNHLNADSKSLANCVIRGLFQVLSKFICVFRLDIVTLCRAFLLGREIHVAVGKGAGDGVGIYGGNE